MLIEICSVCLRKVARAALYAFELRIEPVFLFYCIFQPVFMINRAAPVIFQMHIEQLQPHFEYA
jgi:hypothetical protein